jgi:hypothetical protein
VNLKKLLGVIDETEWTALDIDVKAAAFEGLLEKAASEGKKGAGQYFTPRILIKAIVRCMKPDPRTHPEFTICDPACGTGGFLVSSYEWLIQETKGAVERDLAKRLKSRTYFGQELVQRPRRLTLMNLYLHGLEPHIALGDSIYETPSGQRFEVVMTNPPFGTKGANQAPTRDDFTISTSNKQLNFIQHVMTILKPGGRAAVVVPDNCLFADQAGEVFKILTEDCSPQVTRVELWRDHQAATVVQPHLNGRSQRCPRISLAQVWLRNLHFHKPRARYFLQLFFPVVKECFAQTPRAAKRGRTLPAFFLLCNQAAPLPQFFRFVHARSLPLLTQGGKMRFRDRSRQTDSRERSARCENT